MQVQPIRPYNQTSFKATPVGEARKIMQNALTKIASEGDDVNTTEAKNVLFAIKEFGRFFYTKPEELQEKPLKIIVKKYTKDCVILGTDDKGSIGGFFINSSTNTPSYPMSFLETIKTTLYERQDASKIIAKDEEIKSQLFFNQLFGKG